MTPQYVTWQHSSHRFVTNCNDCHVPQDNFFNKYFFKAKDGMRHATLFTLRKERQVIFIEDAGKQVVHNNCIRCHVDLLSDDKLKHKTISFDHARQERTCWECHREVPHGTVNSLSVTPHARGVPLPGTLVPEWLRKMTK